MDDWNAISRATAAEHGKLLAALGQPRRAQQRQLAEIIASSRDCEFGRQHGFADIRDIDQYRRRVPIADYESHAPAIERIAAGETSVLFPGRARFFELTGGSSAGPKLIPYTHASLAALRRALYPWLADLATQRPGITRGRSYWAISPALRARQTTAAGIPVGIANDAEYFGKNLAAGLMRLMAVPASVAQWRNLDDWRYLTLRHLIGCRDLSMISIWNPSFLLDLLEYLQLNRQRFIDDIGNGNPGVAMPAAARPATATGLAADPALAELLASAVNGEHSDFSLLWPRLDTVSCWTDASAALFVEDLKRQFRGVYFQGKGLLATESVVTLPLAGHAAPVLAINSGFFEFLANDGTPHLADELEKNRVYEVIVTSFAGLYRYRLGDRVRCEGFAGQTPLLRFVGRAGLVSDLCGEKLSEDFVLRRLGNTRGFTMLLPVLEPRRGYRLILDAASWTAGDARAYACWLDLELQHNPQYRHARNIGQLGPLQVSRIESPWRRYLEQQHANGKILGDIKPPVLSNDCRLIDCFRSRHPAGEARA